MPFWMAYSFQDNASPFMENILFFHDHSMIILSMITILTLYVVVSLMVTKKFNKYSMEGQEIETIWTVVPAFMLIFIAFPSMKTLYLMEDSKEPTVSLKIIGHQWYWSYEYTSLNETEIESFMENSKLFRLLKTSELVSLPVLNMIRGLVTSNDVIHSWTVPVMGVKVDALPGRLNQIFLFSKRLGLFTGQCSEICGMNHSFMPITVKFCSTKEFLTKI
uniref:Cytochrome c oxidase subunit 2 n=1 Tax=Paraleius leontonychus TaxID=1807943 RepID=A0A330JHF2_9ACAR|nr:cytochrome c oxidase subunit II [Paraleius leontonychus]